MARRTALVGAALMGGSNIFKILLQFGILPILAHLLTPASYGLVALAFPFVLFVNIFADAGISNAIIREQNPSPDLESTVFWISTGVGAALTALVAILAWPFSLIVRQPQITPILLTLAPMMLLGGMASVANARVLRDQRLKVFAGSDVISAAAGAAVAVWTAFHGWGAYSLVAQQLALSIIRFLWVMLASGVRIRFVCRPVLLSKFWNFGANIMGIGILDFVSRNVDNLLVGSLLGVSALGHYNMAYQLMRMPELVVAGPVCMSLFPLLSRLSGDITTFRKDALFYMGLIVAVIMPVFAGLAVVSDLAIDVVLGEKWRATVPVLVLLGPAGVGVCIYSLFGTVLYAKGKPHLQLRLSLLIACGIAVGVLVGSTNGISGVAGGVSVAMLIAAPFYLVVVGRELQCSPFTILARFSPSAIATLMMVAAVLIARAALPATAEPVLLVTVAAMGALVYLGAFCLLGGDQTRQAYILLTTSQKLKALRSSAGL